MIKSRRPGGGPDGTVPRMGEVQVSRERSSLAFGVGGKGIADKTPRVRSGASASGAGATMTRGAATSSEDVGVEGEVSGASVLVRSLAGSPGSACGSESATSGRSFFACCLGCLQLLGLAQLAR